MKKRLFSTFLVLTIASLLFISADSSQAQKKKTTTKKKTKTAVAKVAGRLPNHFGKLELTEKQRTEVYAIQAKYTKQIEELEKKLATLKAKRASEARKPLTRTQVIKLNKFIRNTGKSTSSSRVKPSSKKKR